MSDTRQTRTTQPLPQSSSAAPQCTPGAVSCYPPISHFYPTHWRLGSPVTRSKQGIAPTSNRQPDEGWRPERPSGAEGPLFDVLISQLQIPGARCAAGTRASRYFYSPPNSVCYSLPRIPPDGIPRDSARAIHAVREPSPARPKLEIPLVEISRQTEKLCTF
jgi:hypothetical protein